MATASVETANVEDVFIMKRIRVCISISQCNSRREEMGEEWARDERNKAKKELTN